MTEKEIQLITLSSSTRSPIITTLITIKVQFARRSIKARVIIRVLIKHQISIIAASQLEHKLPRQIRTK